MFTLLLCPSNKAGLILFELHDMPETHFAAGIWLLAFRTRPRDTFLHFYTSTLMCHLQTLSVQLLVLVTSYSMIADPGLSNTFPDSLRSHAQMLLQQHIAPVRP